MDNNPLADLESQVKQQRTDKALADMVLLLNQVNDRLGRIEDLLKTSDQTYIK